MRFFTWGFTGVLAEKSAGLVGVSNGVWKISSASLSSANGMSSSNEFCMTMPSVEIFFLIG